MTSQITAQMVKELRERTGVGMSKCKEALSEVNGDMEAAISHLRKTGMASAVKKEGRETKEGLILSAQSDSCISVVEISAETDFVVKNDVFQEFAKSVAEEVARSNPSSPEALGQQAYSKDNSMTIDEFRASVIQSLGENIQVKRLVTFPRQENSSYGVYSHMGGKIVCLVHIEGSSTQDELAREIAMHTAAEAPEYLEADTVPAEVIANEEEIARTQAEASGKPDHIIGKIVEGKLKSYYDQVCLLRQKYIKDSDMNIQQLLDKHSKESGQTLSIHSFIRWKVGSSS